MFWQDAHMREPICRLGPYGPYILHGRENRRDRNVDWSHEASDCYELVTVEDGDIDVSIARKRSRRSAPCAFLFRPGIDFRLQVGRGVAWNRLAFDAMHQPRKPGTDCPDSAVHVDNKPQPAPLEIWGVDLPIEIPEPFVRSAIDCVLWCNARYWRDTSQLLRANRHLGGWLLDLVDYLMGEPEPEDWLGRLEHYCRQQMCHRLTVQQLARHAGMSRQTLRCRLEKQCGKTPKRFVEEIKTETACKLLRTSDLKVTDVAHHCGYASHAVFTRSFRRVTGLSPSEWRRKNRAGV